MRKGVSITHINSLYKAGKCLSLESQFYTEWLTNYKYKKCLSAIQICVNKALGELRITSNLNLKVNLCCHLKIIKYFMNIN